MMMASWPRKGGHSLVVTAVDWRTVGSDRSYQMMKEDSSEGNRARVRAMQAGDSTWWHSHGLARQMLPGQATTWGAHLANHHEGQGQGLGIDGKRLDAALCCNFNHHHKGEARPPKKSHYLLPRGLKPMLCSPQQPKPLLPTHNDPKWRRGKRWRRSDSATPSSSLQSDEGFETPGPQLLVSLHC